MKSTVVWLLDTVELNSLWFNLLIVIENKQTKKTQHCLSIISEVNHCIKIFFPTLTTQSYIVLQNIQVFGYIPLITKKNLRLDSHLKSTHVEFTIFSYGKNAILKII